MKTPDQTLKQFLEQYSIGDLTVFTDEQLTQIGCTQSDTSNTEVLRFELLRDFELGELMALAASYVIRLGYKEVHVTQLTLDNLLQDDNDCHTGLISGNNDDQDRIMIQVSYNNWLGHFVKSY